MLKLGQILTIFLVFGLVWSNDESCDTDVILYPPKLPQNRIFVISLVLAVYTFVGIITSIFQITDISISDDVLFLVGILYGYIVVRKIEFDKDIFSLLTFLPIYIYLLQLTEADKLLKYWEESLIGAFGLVFLQAYLLGALLWVTIFQNWNFMPCFAIALGLLVNNPIPSIHYLRRTSTPTDPIILLLQASDILGTCVYYLAANIAVGKHKEDTTLQLLTNITIDIVGGIITAYGTNALVRILRKYEIPVIILDNLAPLGVGSFILLITGRFNAIFCLTVGITYYFQRVHLPADLYHQMIAASRLFCKIASACNFFYAGILVGKLILTDIEPYDFVIIFIEFTLQFIIRLFSFILASPALIYLGYNLSFKKIIVATFASILESPSPICIVVLTTSLFSFETNYDQGRTALCLYMGYHMLSMLANRLMFIAVLKFTNLSDHSSAKVSNMNKRLMYLRSRRIRLMTMYKMDKNKADVNWNLVTEFTSLKHPFKIPIDFTDNVICPDCKTEILRFEAKQKKSGLMNIARKRILMARRHIYNEYLDLELLGRRTSSYLINMVDNILASEDMIYQLDVLKRKFTLQSLTKNFRRVLMDIYFFDILRDVGLPKNLFCRLCYQLIKFRIVDVVILIVSATRLISFCVLSSEELSEETFFGGVAILISPLYLSEILCVMCALASPKLYPDGIVKGFKSPETMFNVVIFLLNFWEQIKRLLHPIQHSLLLILMCLSWSLKILNVLRKLIFLTCEDKMRPKFKPRYNLVNIRRANYALELGIGFWNAERELLQMMSKILDNKSIRSVMKFEIQSNLFEVVDGIVYIARLRNWLATTYMTKFVILMLMNEMDRAIKDLYKSGWLERTEMENLREQVLTRKHQNKKIKYVKPPTPKEIFEEIPWLKDKKMAKHLLNNVQSLVFNPGDIIINHDHAQGIFIVITGLMKLEYSPNSKVLARLENFGELPVVEYLKLMAAYFSGLNYLSVGSSFGEFSTLSNRPCSQIITVIQSSHCLFIHKSHLFEAMEVYDDPLYGLEANLWKTILMKLALEALQQLPIFHIMQEGKLESRLEYSFVPNLSTYKTLVLNPMISDMVLIQGQLIDEDTKEFYTAPCIIPTTAKILSSPHDLNEGKKHLYPDVKLMFVLHSNTNAYEFYYNLWKDSQTSSELTDDFHTKRKQFSLQKNNLLELNDQGVEEEQVKLLETPMPTAEAPIDDFQERESVSYSLSEKSVATK